MGDETDISLVAQARISVPRASLASSERLRVVPCTAKSAADILDV
jgi:hypothetical protein